jgi:copper chaperone
MMSETVLKIEGMTCMHCKMSIEKALKVVTGVTDAEVDLAKSKSWFQARRKKPLWPKP